jgi:prepilin-type N-terminal cleavage/methylation domain-containing protein
MRAGFTLPELAAVIVIVGLLTAVAVPRLTGWNDRLATHRAAAEVVAFYGRARFAAIQRGTGVRLTFGADSLIAVYEGLRDSTVLVWPGPRHLGVVLQVSRSAIRIYPNGLGWGAANTKIVLHRGAAAESLTTSRLGRLKHWH